MAPPPFSAIIHAEAAHDAASQPRTTTKMFPHTVLLLDAAARSRGSRQQQPSSSSPPPGILLPHRRAAAAARCNTSRRRRLCSTLRRPDLECRRSRCSIPPAAAAAAARVLVLPRVTTTIVVMLVLVVTKSSRRLRRRRRMRRVRRYAGRWQVLSWCRRGVHSPVSLLSTTDIMMAFNNAHAGCITVFARGCYDAVSDGEPHFRSFVRVVGQPPQRQQQQPVSFRIIEYCR